MISNTNLSASQYDRQYSAQSAVKFVDTTGKKTRKYDQEEDDNEETSKDQRLYGHDAVGLGEGFGTSEFHNPNTGTPGVSSHK